MKNRKISVVNEDEDVVIQLHPFKPGQHIERMYLSPVEAMRVYVAMSNYLNERFEERFGNDETTGS